MDHTLTIRSLKMLTNCDVTLSEARFHFLQFITRPFQKRFRRSLRKCSDFDHISFYKGLGRKIFVQISLRLVPFSVW